MAAGKRLIVNADDFGRSAGVNQGILDAHRRGIVTSASLIVACPASQEAGRLAAETPGLGVGLHLAFTAGLAILPSSDLPSLVDASGRLPDKPDRLADAKPAEVLAEARAQLRRFREIAGRSPTHLDSYQNVHRFPTALEAILTLAWETGLPVRSLSPELRTRFKREGIPAADRLVEPFYGEGATLERLLRLLSGLNLETTELMCHPAAVDDELRAGIDDAEARAQELAILTHPDVRHAIQAAGIRLIQFGEL